jgi:glycosyltransferase involved in cell wall biosynthesis
MVVAGNEYLADFVTRAGAKRMEIIPTVVDLKRYLIVNPRQIGHEGKLPLVGWIGQRATGHLLLPYKNLFDYLISTGKARFAAIGIDTKSIGLSMESSPWMEQTEVSSIMNFDIGIMPLVDEPFERGKCGYKLIQYMACGLPVIASPVGANKQIVDHGVNGFLAETPEQWAKALQILLDDASLRQRMGEAGRKKVEQKYCLHVTGPKLVAFLKKAALSKLNS